jgi:hypothetical protein
MKTKKALLFLTLSIIFAVTIFLIWPHAPLPDATSRLDAERGIYAVLIRDFLNGEDIPNLPIAEYTTLGKYGGAGIDEDIFSRLDDSDQVKQETLRDLEDKNKQFYLIKGYLPLSVAEGLIAPQTWRLSFSRIGFDPYLTQALVVREHYLGCDNEGNCPYGIGGLVLLKNILGKWVIQGEFGQWIAEDA